MTGPVSMWIWRAVAALVGALCGGVLAVVLSLLFSLAFTARHEPDEAAGIEWGTVGVHANVEEWVAVPGAIAGAALGVWMARRRTLASGR